MKRARRAASIVASLSAPVLVTTVLVTTVLVSTVLVTTGILAAAIPARAVGASAPDWQIVATVHYGPGDNASGYSAVVAPTSRDAWVFGGTNPGGPSSPAAQHWNGKHWQSSPLPRGLTGFIVAADASSARNAWAVGDGYALRWNGTNWSVAKTWPRFGQLTSVAAINRDDVWVFGSSAFSGEAGIGAWHFNGRSWIRTGGLASSIYRASAVARNDIWAITAGPRGGSVVCYNGHTWKRVRSAESALTDTQLNNVLATSRISVWVSGISPASGPPGRLVLAHWDGSRWKRFVAPWDVQQPERFASDGAGGIWIPVVTGGGNPATWILHMSRAGRWTRTAIAAGRAAAVGLGDLALIPGTTSLWGSGGLLTTTGGDATIWAHLTGSARSVVSRSQVPPGVAAVRYHSVRYHGVM
ncbi:MAG TPA: hypothetical protein VH307_00330 [Streptosporangiaceae bacterium]|nr:hypothetical protein [Streptosporangiaceae bacterium]